MAADNARVEQLDALWLNIVTELLHKAVAEATTCTETIFNMASLYLRREAFEALAKFYELYFDHNHDSKKNAVNAKVDEIFAAGVDNIEEHGDDGGGMIGYYEPADVGVLVTPISPAARQEKENNDEEMVMMMARSCCSFPSRLCNVCNVCVAVAMGGALPPQHREA